MSPGTGSGQHSPALDPRSVDLFNRAREATTAGETERAVALYRQALERNPGFLEAQLNLGHVLFQWHRLAEAEEVFRRAVTLAPEVPGTHGNLGVVLNELGRLEEALACFQRVVEIQPSAEAYKNLGRICTYLDRREEGIDAFRKALEITPRCSGSLSDLGTLHQRNGDYRQARRCLEESLKIDSSNHLALNNLAKIDMMCGAVEEAIERLRKAMEVCPSYADAHSNLLLACHYQPDARPEDLLREHQAWGRMHAVADRVFPAVTRAADPEKLLRIGFLSPDIRTHSVAYFLENILDRVDRRRIAFCAYAEVARPDATTERLRPKFSEYRSTVGRTDADIARMVARDGIDILVDLAGHTAGNRLKVLALKPAPIQMTYLGYPDTIGLPSVDYRLTDALADPPGQEKYYVEKLVRLPACFLCYRPPDDAPEVGPSPCQRRMHFTFGSFNSASKLNRPLIHSWSNVIRRVEGSRLILKNAAFRDPGTRDRYRSLFASFGVQEDRLQLMGWEPVRTHHLGLYGEVDLCLDSFPYHGTTTTCEALWMGVPVITRRGAIHAARVGCSLLHQVGLEDLIAEDDDGYVETAVRLAGDRDRLTELRTDLRQRMKESPLCDAVAFTRHMENTFLDIWQTWCREHGVQPAGNAGGSGPKPIPVWTSISHRLSSVPRRCGVRPARRRRTAGWTSWLRFTGKRLPSCPTVRKRNGSWACCCVRLAGWKRRAPVLNTS